MVMNNLMKEIDQIKETEILKETKNADFFSLKGLRKIGKVVSVYDGDTCNIVLVLENRPVKFRCRLLGVDCAERRSSNQEEKECALRARDFFTKWVNDELVIVDCHQFDKYGRLLTTVYKQDSGVSINDLLLKEKLAYSYSGGTRENFEDWYNSRDCLVSAQSLPKSIDDYNFYEGDNFRKNLESHFC